MKKYLVFIGGNFYPEGGWHDFVGDFDTLQDALVKVVLLKDDWFHIVDRDTMRMVELDKVNN